MGNITKMIQWMTDRKGTVAYAMVRPWGGGNPPQYDCSAAVISALRAGGFMDYSGGNYGNTGTLQTITMPKIAKQISRSECKNGDIFLSNPTAPEDGDAHTGLFIDNQTIIHCNWGSKTISTTPADGYMGQTPHFFWRLNETTDDNNENKESEEIGMWVFYRANDQSPLVWFNGEHAYPLNNQDEQKAINDIYKANFGKEVPFINHWKDGSPYYSRLANVLKRTPFF